ncbi:MAG: PDZ domain-containing protein, partial [Acidobacteria bacterium]|nr:PDZ domain-containing protein [Acidobacteriota bacterium]
MKRLPVFVVLAVIGLLGIGDMRAQGTRLLRQPTVSAEHIAFTYANDIWIVGHQGGEARRLTSFQGQEIGPRLAPDGSLIAFSAQYDGNTDVFTVPVAGGEPRRLTWHPGPDLARGWSPDGSQVVFNSGRDSVPWFGGGPARLWTVPVEGGFPQALPMPRGDRGHYSPDGKHFVYQPIQLWDAGWRGYRGGQIRPIWVLDLKTLEVEELPWEMSRDTTPVWLGSSIYFLSDRKDQMANIYSYDTGSRQVTAITSHDDFDVMWLEAGGGVLVYEQAGYLHLHDPAAGSSRRLDITARGDFPWARPHWEEVGDTLTNASLSPTGKRALFEGRGEIFSMPAEKGDWRNLTRSAGVADRWPSWSPDGARIAWFSDAGGEYELMVGSQDGLENPRAIPIKEPTFFFTPAWSPDSKKIVFTDTDLGVWYVDVESGRLTLVDYDTWTEPLRTLNPVWSLDSKWIAYAKRLDTHLHAIYIHSLATGKTHQVTDGLSDALSPAWDAAGKYLYFLAGTDLGLNVGWLDMSSYEHAVHRAVYALVLNSKDPSPLPPESDEEEPDDDEEKDSDDTETSEDESVEVVVDLEGMERRIVSLDIPVGEYVRLRAGEEGILFYGENNPGNPGFKLHRYSLEDRESVKFLPAYSSFSLSADGKKMLYHSEAGWHLVDTGEPPEPEDGKLDTDSLRMKVDPAREWRQMFRDGWRFQRDFLYVENLHGADWDAVWKMYEPWVQHVRHRSDLTYLLDIMAGEVGVGHSFTGGGDIPDVEQVGVGLLGADLEIHKGRYRITRIYTGENWNPDIEAPLSGPGMDAHEGDYILSINGRELTADDNPYGHLEATAGRQTVLRLSARPGGDKARTLTVVPVESEWRLRRQAWIEDNRRKVDEMSGGRLGYVYLSDTGQGGYTLFNRYYFAQQDRDGVIIDERFNGGGSAADYMIDIMNRKLYGFFNSPSHDRKPDPSPAAGIWGPKVMIINESAGSGGDYLPYMFKKAGIGPLVGTRTWGGLVGIWDTPPFIDGGFITAPRGGFFNTEGVWEVENEGVTPD